MNQTHVLPVFLTERSDELIIRGPQLGGRFIVQKQPLPKLDLGWSLFGQSKIFQFLILYLFLSLIDPKLFLGISDAKKSQFFISYELQLSYLLAECCHFIDTFFDRCHHRLLALLGSSNPYIPLLINNCYLLCKWVVGQRLVRQPGLKVQFPLSHEFCLFVLHCKLIYFGYLIKQKIQTVNFIFMYILIRFPIPPSENSILQASLFGQLGHRQATPTGHSLPSMVQVNMGCLGREGNLTQSFHHIVRICENECDCLLRLLFFILNVDIVHLLLSRSH